MREDLPIRSGWYGRSPKNKGKKKTKWMVYKGKTLLELMIWGGKQPNFWKHPYGRSPIFSTLFSPIPSVERPHVHQQSNGMLGASSVPWGEEFLQELPEIMAGAPNTEVPFHDTLIPLGMKDWHDRCEASKGIVCVGEIHAIEL